MAESGVTFDLYAFSFATVIALVTAGVMWLAHKVDGLPYEETDCPDEVPQPSHVKIVPRIYDWRDYD